jgi:hypothetical protein
MFNHDWKYHASQTGSADGNTKRCSSILMEPSGESAHRRVEDHTSSDRTADALSEDELVIFGGERCHHEAEDMEEGASKENPSRTIVVIQLADDRTLG